MLPLSISEQCQRILDANILAVKPLPGGDINQASLLKTSAGLFFVKMNAAPQSGQMFEAESLGLKLLASTGTLLTPSVLGVGDSDSGGFLLLEFIETGYRPIGFWEQFGAGLAELHRNTSPSFGLDHDNFIGSLPQSNCQHDTWPDFYVNERLLPQLDIAMQQNRLQSTDFQDFEMLFKQIPTLCPNEPPALIHGDLWSGNFLCDTQGQPILIDPAVSYSHREMDIAMSRLFGGFERPFYKGYEEAWPLVPGFEQRLPVYQIYYLLVHVNLFGGGYVESVRSALQQFI